jgi:predicted RNase H-like nuclease
LNRRSSPHGVGLSKQTFNLFPALRQVDAFMTAEKQNTFKETHPELVFRRLNDDQTVQAPKRTQEGRDIRRSLLVERTGIGAKRLTTALDQARDLKAAPDDVLDAIALAAAAHDILLGRAVRLPADPPRDSRGLWMEIWG